MLSQKNKKYIMENLKNEIWKEVKNFEGLYEVSSFGSVRSLDRVVVDKNGISRNLEGVVLKPYLDRNYYEVTLNNVHDTSIKKKYKIHQLVAIAFLEHERDGMNIIVDHINNDSKNNNVNNLQLITNRENVSKDRHLTSRKCINLGSYYRDDYDNYKSSIFITKSIHLGIFDSEEEAAAHYVIALGMIDKYKGCPRNFRLSVKCEYNNQLREKYSKLSNEFLDFINSTIEL